MEEICKNCAYYDNTTGGYCEHKEYYGFYDPEISGCGGDAFLISDNVDSKED